MNGCSIGGISCRGSRVICMGSLKLYNYMGKTHLTLASGGEHRYYYYDIICGNQENKIVAISFVFRIVQII